MGRGTVPAGAASVPVPPQPMAQGPAAPPPAPPQAAPPPPPPAPVPPPRREPGDPPRHRTGEQPRLRGFTGEQPRLAPERQERPGPRPQPQRPALTPNAKRFRLAALAAVAVLLLGALPAFFVIRDAVRDPVFAGLDALNLPSWADQQHVDQASGSRWCVDTCRLRERTWRSAKTAQETDPVYESALLAAGWSRWHTAGCPKGGTGVYTCWQRDQYKLDLWTRPAACALNDLAPTLGPSANASATPVPTPTGTGPPPTCAGSLVTATVADGADPSWHK